MVMSLLILLALQGGEPPKPTELKIRPPVVSQTETVTEPLITIKMSKAKLGAVLAEVAKQANISVISDAFVNDTAIEELSIEASPLSFTLETVASTYGRRIHKIHGLYVLRSYNFALSALHEQTALKKIGLQWEGKGVVQIQRNQSPAETAVTTLPKTLTSVMKAEGKPVPQLPALTLSVQVQNATFLDTLKEFSAVSGLRVAVEPDLAERRLSAYIHGSSPGHILTALGLLFNTSARMTLERNEANRILEAALLDSRLPILKLSDALATKIAKFLTEDQKKQLQKGQQVVMNFTQLSGDALKLAKDYALQALLSGLPNGMSLDTTRLGDFSLQLNPAMPLVGVNGYLKDGRGIHY